MGKKTQLSQKIKDSQGKIDSKKFNNVHLKRQKNW